MNLQEMLKEVHRYDENVIIAEFKNGMGVMYEKTPKGILYATVPEVVNDRYHPTRETCRWDARLVQTGEQLLEDRLIYGSSENFLKITNHFKEKSYKNKLEQKIQEQFGKIVDELEVTKFFEQEERDWGRIGLYLSAALLAPAMAITLPLLGAYMIATRNEYQGSGGIGVALMAVAPIVFPAMAIKEIVSPATVEYNCIGKMTVGEKKDSLPAVDLEDNPYKFRHMKIYFSTGDAGYVPNIFTENYEVDDFHREQNEEKYKRATQFLNISPEVNNEMNRLLEERAAFPKVLKDFTAQLNKENQEALLKSIGFL